MKKIIEVGDVRVSTLTGALMFTIVCTQPALELLRDDMQPGATPEEEAQELATKLERVIISDHRHGGQRLLPYS